MKIYISGISGTGMGPLALMAKQAGHDVYGSDLKAGAIYEELIRAGIEVKIGKQDGEFLREKMSEGVDWFVYTSALNSEHPELKLARESGIKTTKRDDFTAFLVEELGLKMIAVAGTHGKTTTTAMIVWAGLKLGLPISYIVGTILGFAPSGAYHAGDKYFVYEADEYDRNFLKFHPWRAVIPFVSYDHPDIYASKIEYQDAFLQFESQSEKVIKAGFNEAVFNLAGEVRRKDAGLASEAIREIYREEGSAYENSEIIGAMNEFPGIGRRFEKIAEGVYSDYAHHPEEIRATIEIAKEEAERTVRKGVVVLYEPHQNTRQHEVLREYRDTFLGAEKVYWLPTFLTREDESLPILRPEDFIDEISNREIIEAVKMNEMLAEKIRRDAREGYLVVLMSAGPADEWLRAIF